MKMINYVDFKSNALKAPTNSRVLIKRF